MQLRSVFRRWRELIMPALIACSIAACVEAPNGPGDNPGSNNNNNPVAYTEPLSVVLITAFSPVVGQPYARQFSAQGGTPPYTWTITSGTPPTGLSMNSRGLVSGTPVDTVTRTYSVRVTDSRGATSGLSTTSKPVSGGTFPFVLGPLTLAVVGQNGDTGFQPAMLGGTLPYVFSATGLPPGLTIDPATGVISGRATSTGTFDVILTVRDAAGLTASASAPVVAVAPTAPLAGSNKYDGTWIGVFNEQYEMCPATYGHNPKEKNCTRLNAQAQLEKTALITGSYTLRVTMRVEAIGPASNGYQFTRVTSFSVSDTRLGCSVSGCAVSNGSIVTFNDPPLNISTQAVGVVLMTPGGLMIATENAAGAAHMSSTGTLMSNSLDPAIRRSNWLGILPNLLWEETLIPGWQNAGYHEITAKSWVLTKSGL